jgi:hypothetical protein
VTKANKRKRRGPTKGHSGRGGRPRGVEMPCGWKCGARLTAVEIRQHFTGCPKRPSPNSGVQSYE